MHDLLQRAHRLSVCASTAERATAVVAVLGSRLASASLGVANASNLLRWSDGRPIKDVTTEHRLQVLHRLVTALSLAYGDTAAVAFMRACNPDLDGEPPMHVLARNRPTSAEPRLLTAVERLLTEMTRRA